MNRVLSQHSDTSVSLDMHFSMQARSGRSLPRSLEPFAQPVHVDVREVDEDADDVTSTLDGDVA